jgi:hypothetical protein
MSTRRVSLEEHLGFLAHTEAAFERALRGLDAGRADDLVALMGSHPDLRERVLCTVAAGDAAGVDDLCLDPAAVLVRVDPAPVGRVVRDYLEHWRLRMSVVYKGCRFPQTYDSWTRTVVDDGRDIPHTQ